MNFKNKFLAIFFLFVSNSVLAASKVSSSFKADSQDTASDIATWLCGILTVGAIIWLALYVFQWLMEKKQWSDLLAPAGATIALGSATLLADWLVSFFY